MRQKTVLVTGATKGIGRETSKNLNFSGYEVIGIARNSVEGFPGVLFCCDLSDPEATASTISQIKKNYRVDAIVNNVGIAHPQSLGSISLATLHEVYDLNVRVAVQIVQGFLDEMKHNRWGRIVNIASRAVLGIIDRTSYSAAKSALIGCTRTWALELAPFGITVNAVAPGPTETELFRQKQPAGSAAEKRVLSAIPMGRIGYPKEIAAAIAFLLSEDASFMTGQTLHIDGGSSLPH